MWFRHGVVSGGFMLLGWAAFVFVVAALTTWWVLLALAPLAMMAIGMAMTGPMARSAGADPRAGLWGWCAAWVAPTGREEVERERRVDHSTR